MLYLAHPSPKNCWKKYKRMFRIPVILVSCILLMFPPLVTSAAPADRDPGSSPLAALAWEKLGGPPGGSGSSFIVHPDNPDILYLSDLSGGVFISRDGGESWIASNQGITVRTGTVR